jgi:pyruvate formate-lyase activating enzyme-like uncharacterized protein
MTKTDDTKELLTNLKNAHKAMGAALTRIDELERALRSISTDLTRLKGAFGTELKIHWYSGTSWGDMPIRTAIDLMENSIKKVCP